MAISPSALALATVLAIGAGMGQQTAVMRFHAEDMAKKDSAAAQTTLRAGSMLTILGSLLVAAALCLYAALADALRGSAPSWPLYAAALLVLPMALSEFTSAALRTQGSIWTALAPRDVLWRLALPLAALALAAAGIMLTGWGALLLAAGLLLVVVAAQYGLARTERYQLPLGFAGLAGFWRARGKISLWLLLGGFINAAALNADTIVIGALLAPEQAGSYFNAFRTGGLMTLFAFAISLVIAPRSPAISMPARNTRRKSCWRRHLGRLCFFAARLHRLRVFRQSDHEPVRTKLWRCGHPADHSVHRFSGRCGHRPVALRADADRP
jgi:O-antigen/teichoic acid export membrane protein